MTTATYATEVKLFNKWSYDDIEVSDISLEVSAAPFNACCSVFFEPFSLVRLLTVGFSRITSR